MLRKRYGGHMQSIAFHIEKGGSGKTTLTGTIAHELSKYNRVLMLDADPQGNLSSWYVENSFQFDLADALQGKCSINDAIVEVRPNLSIIPTAAIGGELKTWSETTLFQKPFAFHDLIDGITGYDIVLVDLGPGISNLEKSVISVMGEVIGVLAAEYFSADGLEIFEYELEQLKKDRRAKFKANKLVINRINRSYSLHSAYLDEFKKLPYEVFMIGQSTGISDCVPSHKTVFEYAPGDRNTSEFQRLAKEISNGA